MELALDQIQWRDDRGRRVRLSLVGGALISRPFRRSIKEWIVWATGKSNTQISNVLNATLNAASFVADATIYAAIWTSTLNAASTGATAGEASYTGYARVAITCNTTNFPTSSGGAAITNATAITFPANGGSLQTGTFFALVSTASGAGTIRYWGSITSTAINPGDTPQVAIGALTVTEV